VEEKVGKIEEKKERAQKRVWARENPCEPTTPLPSPQYGKAQSSKIKCYLLLT